MSSIPLYPDSTFESPHDYGPIRVQAGDFGIVIGNPIRTTAFVECFPEGSFFRGEGATVAEADDACWAKLHAYLNCPGHNWEPRHYRNGSGYCTVCGQYGSEVLTAAQLSLFCTTCGEPTFNTLTGSKAREPRCPEHDPKGCYTQAAVLAMFHGFDDETKAMTSRLDAVVAGEVDEDPAALDWAYANLKRMRRQPEKGHQ